jgi:hypothetical protein
MMVYDTERHQAHSLNRTAALVWQQCDGKTSVPELAARLGELGLPAEEAVIWLALDRLEKAQLLQEPLRQSGAPAGDGISRRAVIRKLGLAGGLAALLPLVHSLDSPAAAAAQSVGCLPENSTCQPGGGLCCSGLACVEGHCEAPA